MELSAPKVPGAAMDPEGVYKARDLGKYKTVHGSGTRGDVPPLRLPTVGVLYLFGVSEARTGFV